MPKTEYGEALLHIRKGRKELLRDMAARIGYTPNYLSQIENGMNQIPKDLTKVIVQKYELKTSEFSLLKNAEKAVRKKKKELDALRNNLDGDTVKISKEALKVLIVVHRKQEAAFTSAKDFVEAAKHNGAWRAYASLLEDNEEAIKEGGK